MLTTTRNQFLLFALLLSLFSVRLSSGQAITIGADGIVRCKNVAIDTTHVVGFSTYEVADRVLLIH